MLIGFIRVISAIRIIFDMLIGFIGAIRII